MRKDFYSSPFWRKFVWGEYKDLGPDYEKVTILTNMDVSEQKKVNAFLLHIFAASRIGFNEIYSRKENVVVGAKEFKVPRINQVPFIVNESEKKEEDINLPLTVETVYINYANLINNLLCEGINGLRYIELLQQETPVVSAQEDYFRADNNNPDVTIAQTKFDFSFGRWFPSCTKANIALLIEYCDKFLCNLDLLQGITDGLQQSAKLLVDHFIMMFSSVAPHVTMPFEAINLMIIAKNAETILFLIDKKKFKDEVNVVPYFRFYFPEFLTPDNIRQYLIDAAEILYKTMVNKILEQNAFSLDKICKTSRDARKFVRRIGSFISSFMQNVFEIELATTVELVSQINIIRIKNDEYLTADNFPRFTDFLRNLYAASVASYIKLTKAEEVAINICLFNLKSNGRLPLNQETWDVSVADKEALIVSIEENRIKYSFILSIFDEFVIPCYHNPSYEVFHNCTSVSTIKTGGIQQYIKFSRTARATSALRSHSLRLVGNKIVSCQSTWIQSEQFKNMSGTYVYNSGNRFLLKGTETENDAYAFYNGQYQDLLEIIARNSLHYFVSYNEETHIVVCTYLTQLIAHYIMPPDKPMGEQVLAYVGAAEQFRKSGYNWHICSLHITVNADKLINNSSLVKKLAEDKLEPWIFEREQVIDANNYSNANFSCDNLTALLFSYFPKDLETISKHPSLFYQDRFEQLFLDQEDYNIDMSLIVDRFIREVGHLYDEVYRNHGMLRKYVDVQCVPSIFKKYVNNNTLIGYNNLSIVNATNTNVTEVQCVPYAVQLPASITFKLIIPYHLRSQEAKNRVDVPTVRTKIYNSVYRLEFNYGTGELTINVFTSSTARDLTLLNPNGDVDTNIVDHSNPSFGYVKLDGKHRIFFYSYPNRELNGSFQSPLIFFTRSDDHFYSIADVTLSPVMLAALDKLKDISGVKLSTGNYNEWLKCSEYGLALWMINYYSLAIYKNFDYNLGFFNHINVDVSQACVCINECLSKLTQVYSDKFLLTPFLPIASANLGQLTALVALLQSEVAEYRDLLKGTVSKGLFQKLSILQANYKNLKDPEYVKKANELTVKYVTGMTESIKKTAYDIIGTIDSTYRNNEADLILEAPLPVTKATDNLIKIQHLFSGQFFIRPPKVFQSYTGSDELLSFLSEDTSEFVSRGIVDWLNDFAFWGSLDCTIYTSEGHSDEEQSK